MRIFCGFQKIEPDSSILAVCVIAKHNNNQNGSFIELFKNIDHVKHISFYIIWKHIYLDINGSHSMLQYCII